MDVGSRELMRTWCVRGLYRNRYGLESAVRDCYAADCADGSPHHVSGQVRADHPSRLQGFDKCLLDIACTRLWLGRELLPLARRPSSRRIRGDLREVWPLEPGFVLPVVGENLWPTLSVLRWPNREGTGSTRTMIRLPGRSYFRFGHVGGVGSPGPGDNSLGTAASYLQTHLA